MLHNSRSQYTDLSHSSMITDDVDNLDTIVYTVSHKNAMNNMSSLSKNMFQKITSVSTNITTQGLSLFQNNIYYVWICFCIFLGAILSIQVMNTHSLYFAFPVKDTLHTLLFTPKSLILEQDKSAVTAEEISPQVFTHMALYEYEIQPGDVLLHIARDHNRKIDTLVSWNNIKDARRIRAGDTLSIPNKDGILYIVKSGDTLSSVANKHNISEVSLLDSNNLSTSTLSKGSKLFIPGGTMDEFELGLVLGTVFLRPTRGTISSYYGYRTSPFTGIWSFHGGLDIANNTGTPIYATSYGTVNYVSYSSPLYGRVVIIQHPNGFQSLYAHLDEIYVRKGQYISRGRTIGSMGNTGLSTGPHLHFSLILNGKSINPLKYLSF